MISQTALTTLAVCQIMTKMAKSSLSMITWPVITGRPNGPYRFAHWRLSSSSVTLPPGSRHSTAGQ